MLDGRDAALRGGPAWRTQTLGAAITLPPGRYTAPGCFFACSCKQTNPRNTIPCLMAGRRASLNIALSLRYTVFLAPLAAAHSTPAARYTRALRGHHMANILPCP